ncbi:MAG: cyclic nucleotide-binding domain-containing protein [Elusimicrobia bacterium]|nr:cyclic nucleotide-binding domain-containing protein [Elusimicrobiota bacterium]
MFLKSFTSFFLDPEHKKTKQFLAGLPIFKGLRRMDFVHLMQVLQDRTYLKDEVIFSEGDIGRALFIVVSGRVHIKRRTEAGEIVLATVNPGEIFGEMALLEEMPRTAGAVAAEKAQVFMLYKCRLDSLLYEYPSIGVVVIHYLAQTLSARLRANIESKKTDASPAEQK